MSYVTVLGSLHLDIVVEAPRQPGLGETLMGSGWRQVAGGKGLNQAVSCAKAGLETRMLGLVGNDGFADTLLGHLQKHQVDTQQVLRVDNCGSGMSVAIVQSDGDYAAVVASEANLLLNDSHVKAWSDLLAASSALVLQNEIPAAVNLEAAKIVATAGGLVILNAAPAREADSVFFKHVSVLIVNSVEAEMMGSKPVLNLSSAQDASDYLHKTFGPDVVVTAGKDGAAWTGSDTQNGGGSGSISALPVKVISAHGAGDTFVGCLVAELVRGQSLGAAVKASNKAAALYVSTPRA
ncbi:ribokinase [Rhodoferax sp. 4810]|nr:ribokinase [Rhodoferax jenense]